MEKKLSTTCGYCSTGCNFYVSHNDRGELKAAPNPDYPVNQGTSCPKGFLMLEPLKAEDRALTPYIRDRAGNLEPTDWDTALTAFTDNIRAIQGQYGKDSIAFLSTGQLPTEEMALLGALAKFGMGMIHGDGNTRQCMATAAYAYKTAFGFDAPPFTYKDFEESDVLVFVGANPVIAHPVMWNRVKKNSRNPRIMVIDPRETETARSAERHYRIKPDSLLVFLYGLANLLIENGWIDQTYIDKSTTGFEAFKNFVARFPLAEVSKHTGIGPDAIMALVDVIHEGERVSLWWTMGVNQNYQAVACAWAVINLALMTGNIGRPGTGANSITGQANAMGSRIFSNTTSLFAGYDFLKPDDRRKVAGILDMDPDLIPDRNSLPYDGIIEGIDKGEIKGLWIICTNPCHSWIDKNRLFNILDKLEYLVVQDIYHTTETARRADLVLAAAGAGEKAGTFVNSERRIGVVGRVAAPPGSARSDFEIFKGIAEKWGCAELFRAWSSPEAVFNILKRLSQGRPCDITGIEGYRAIEERGGVQWPFPAGSENTAVERRLFEDGKYYTEDGKARFLFEEPTLPPEETDREFPFVLLSGRGTVAQWHTQTRTGKVPMLRKMYPAEAYVEINETDAERLGIKQDAKVLVRSRRGKAVVRAAVGAKVAPGQVFMPMHYPETNFLTFPFFDPHSREPSYKYAAVDVRPEE